MEEEGDQSRSRSVARCWKASTLLSESMSNVVWEISSGARSLFISLAACAGKSKAEELAHVVEVGVR